jgi:histidinol-phosphatase (PHP family)
MAGHCERALAIGVPAIAFTEHLEFTAGFEGDAITGTDLDASWSPWIKALDVDGYLAAIDECRQRYPGLRVLSGVEAGETHLFGASAAAVVRTAPFDRVLGSLHVIAHEGRLIEAGHAFRLLPAADVMERYLDEVARLVNGSDLFQVLAHLDYPRRHWPRAAGPYDETRFEEQFRLILSALAQSGRVLELNTKTPLASVHMLSWWRDEGGAAVSFGSDAHETLRVGDKFKLAADIVEAAGFRPGRDPYDFWRI